VDARLFGLIFPDCFGQFVVDQGPVVVETLQKLFGIVYDPFAPYRNRDAPLYCIFSLLEQFQSARLERTTGVVVDFCTLYDDVVEFHNLVVVY